MMFYRGVNTSARLFKNVHNKKKFWMYFKNIIRTLKLVSAYLCYSILYFCVKLDQRLVKTEKIVRAYRAHFVRQ